MMRDSITEALGWVLMVVAAVGGAVAGTARTMIVWGKWRGRPLFERFIDWMDQRSRTSEEERLLQIYWWGFVVALVAFWVGLILILRARG